MKKEWVTYVRRLADLNEGEGILFIKDLTPGPRKYDTRLVRAELSRNAGRLVDGEPLWVRSETGYTHPQPWKIKILQDLPPYVPGQPWEDIFGALRQMKR